jgi:hypothetical protein
MISLRIYRTKHKLTNEPNSDIIQDVEKVRAFAQEAAFADFDPGFERADVRKFSAYAKRLLKIL